MTFHGIIVAPSLLLLSTLAGAQLQVLTESKLIATEADSFDWVGIAVSLSGDTAIVGAPRDSHGGPATNAGAAYIFERSANNADDWIEVARLVASDGGAFDSFGGAVSIHGDTAIVGGGTAAYVFERNTGGSNNWGETRILTVSPPPGFFGVSLAITGDTAVVGSYANVAFVFSRDSGGADQWGEIAQLVPDDVTIEHQFGAPVAIDGDRIAVGAIGAFGGSGAVYLFERNAGGASNWGQVAKLTPKDALPGSLFGGAVAVRDDVIATVRTVAQGIGEIYLFHEVSSTWVETRKLVPSETNNTYFGSSLSLSNDRLVAGRGFPFDASGEVHVFERNSGGPNAWGKVAVLAASDTSGLTNNFGQSAALDGQTILVGAPGDDSLETDRGSAYAYRVGTPRCDLTTSYGNRRSRSTSSLEPPRP